MNWNDIYNENNPPSIDNINKFIGNQLWGSLNSFLKDTYHIEPKLSYSKCSAKPGWNVKYQKSSKSLCTLYPMEGFFTALVVIGNKESFEVEILLPALSSYTQALYKRTPFSAGGRWLMIDVTDKDILEDVIKLIKLRKAPA